MEAGPEKGKARVNKAMVDGSRRRDIINGKKE